MTEEKEISSSGKFEVEIDTPGELMRKAQDGDQAAYTKLLQSLVRPIQTYIAHHFPGVSDRDDIMQESLITLHKIRHTYDPTRPFTPWLFAIVRHRSLDYLRKHTRIQSREVRDELAFAHAAAPDIHDSVESREAVLAMLAILSEKERSVIQLLKVDQLSVKDVAVHLGLSESNVKVIASRGYEKLRRARKE
jgi:RNA polymerase sigma-70 factor, ECF subfamily